MCIFGDTSFAQIAQHYFLRNSEYDVLFHIVDRGYRTSNFIGEIPVYEMEQDITMDSIKKSCDAFFVASTYTNLNRLRTKKYEILKANGLKPASYISPEAFVDSTAQIGEHVFIFENNTVQFQTRIGNNNIIWSGNHIGHHSQIGHNNFLASQVILSGHVVLGNNCFLGVNSTVINNIKIEDDCWIGPNALVTENLTRGSFIKASASKKSSQNTYDRFSI